MLKPLLLAACVGFALAGCAAAPETALDSSTAQSAARECLTTGSRIVSKEHQCTNAAGRTYSQDELEATGATSTAEALERVDPRITTSGR
jgi:hypothetical protein